MNFFQTRLIRIVLLISLIFIIGIMGYMIIEKWSFIDSLYMSVITLTTVGFMEVQPLSVAGRLFTILYLIVGFSVIIYGFGVITAFFVEGELMGILRRRNMFKKINKLSDHYIICGAGETGKHVISEFIKTQNPFVLIEKNPDKINLVLEKYGEMLYIEGDASKDVVLQEAGIEKARGLLTTFASDKDNLFVVLTAKGLNPGLRIVARSIEEESEHKLRRAGADIVVSAHLIGGMRMASEMLRPTVVSFLDLMLREKDKVLRIEEAEIQEGSRLENVTVKEANMLQNIGMIVIAIKNGETGQYVYNPLSNTTLRAKDTLIVMGRVDQIKKLKEYVSS